MALNEVILALRRFIDEVLGAGIPLIVISAYHKEGEELARFVLYKHKLASFLLG